MEKGAGWSQSEKERVDTVNQGGKSSRVTRAFVFFPDVPPP